MKTFKKSINQILMILFMIAVTSTLNANTVQSNQKFGNDSLGIELKGRRTLNSKTYFNPETNHLTVRMSAGYMHYKNNEGNMYDINPNIQCGSDTTMYEVTQGLYKAYFPVRLNAISDPVIFETWDSTAFCSQIQMMAYYDEKSGEVFPIAEISDTQGIVEGNRIVYADIFPGINLEYIYHDTRLKQNIYLTQKARDVLPTPESFKLNANHTILVFASLVDVYGIETAIAENQDISSENSAQKEKKEKYKTKKNIKLACAGNLKIDFKNQNNETKFLLMKDIAIFKPNDARGNKEKVEMSRELTIEKDGTRMITGVSYKWLSKLEAGTVILDPTISLDVTKDMFISTSQPDTHMDDTVPSLSIGKAYYRKRVIMQFSVNALPRTAEIISANLKVYYTRSDPSGSTTSRNIACHQIVRGIDNNTVSWNWASYNPPAYWAAWNSAGIGLDNVDAKSTAESVVTFTPSNTGWKSFNLTNLVSSELDGTGIKLVLLAQDDDTGYDEKVIYSSEYTGDVNKRPYLEIQMEMDPIVSYEYDAKGRPVETTYADGTVETNTYDISRGWLRDREFTRDGSDLFYFKNRAFDATGNILEQRVTNPHAGAAFDLITYSYDALYRLTSFNYNVGEITRSYSYDINGNIINMGSKNLSYNYSTYKNKCLSDGTRTFGYDAIGRMTQHGSVTNIQYDFRNNMIEYGSDEYRYDADNQRIKKLENGEEMYYIRQGLNTLAEYGDSDGDSELELEAEYIYGVDGIVAKYRPNGGYYFFYKDHLGSTRHIGEISGSYGQANEYFPYGESLAEAGTETSYKFTGKELDSGTGLYYFGARYYDPSIGRWLVPDPLADKYPGLSPYNYAMNNPLNRIDPDGQFPFNLANSYMSGVGHQISNVVQPVINEVQQVSLGITRNVSSFTAYQAEQTATCLLTISPATSVFAPEAVGLTLIAASVAEGVAMSAKAINKAAGGDEFTGGDIISDAANVSVSTVVGGVGGGVLGEVVDIIINDAVDYMTNSKSKSDQNEREKEDTQDER